jgi:hypothetical protein
VTKDNKVKLSTIAAVAVLAAAVPAQANPATATSWCHAQDTQIEGEGHVLGLERLKWTDAVFAAESKIPLGSKVSRGPEYTIQLPANAKVDSPSEIQERYAEANHKLDEIQFKEDGMAARVDSLLALCSTQLDAPTTKSLHSLHELMLIFHEG